MDNPDFEDIFGEPKPEDDERKQRVELKHLIKTESKNPRGFLGDSYMFIFDPVIEGQDDYEEKMDKVLEILDNTEVRTMICIGASVIECALQKIGEESKSYLYIVFSSLAFWLQQCFTDRMGSAYENALSEIMIEADETFWN